MGGGLPEIGRASLTAVLLLVEVVFFQLSVRVGREEGQGQGWVQLHAGEAPFCETGSLVPVRKG